MYICHFLTIRFPLNLAPKCRKCHFRDSRFQNFRGSMPPDLPRNRAPKVHDFRAFGARKLVSKITRSTHAGLQLYSGTALQLYNSTALQLYSATTLQLYSATTLQLYMQLYSATALLTALQLYSSTALQLYNSTALQLYMQRYSSTALQLYNSTALQLYMSTTLQL